MGLGDDWTQIRDEVEGRIADLCVLRVQTAVQVDGELELVQTDLALDLDATTVVTLHAAHAARLHGDILASSLALVGHRLDAIRRIVVALIE
jgi:hypothetical protein